MLQLSDQERCCPRKGLFSVTSITVAPPGARGGRLLAGGAPRPPLCKGSRRMRKRRLDTLLAERGLFPSRSRAAASVMAGEVSVGVHGRRAAKPSELVEVDAELVVQERPRFVSRGGIK